MTQSSRPDRYALAQQIIVVLEEELVAGGFELLDVRVFQSGGRWQMRVFVDTADGINLDGCARASRTVGMLMEEADLFAGEYLVEVSSPGIRRPLRTPTHFISSVDQDVEVTVRGSKRPRKLRGRLVTADDRGLKIRVVGQTPDGEADAADPEADSEVAVTYTEILEANLDPEFDVQALINAERRQRKEQKRSERQQRRTKKSRRPKKKRD